MMKATTAFACIAIAAVATIADAQGLRETYALRREAGPEAYLIERSYTPPQTQQRQGLVNPAAAAQAAPPAPAAVSRQAQAALRYYGNAQGLQQLQQIPQRRFVSGGGTVPTPGNPTSGGRTDFARPVVAGSQTVSPYLNLFREEQGDSAPNYHAFVRPQLEQQQAARVQQLEIERLRRQVQSNGAAPTGVRPAGYAPRARGARFGDTGQFYGSW